MICYQPVFIVCSILVGFNSHLTCAVSETVGPSSVAQVSRACPEDQLKWTPSGTSDFTAADKPNQSGSLGTCKEECKRTNGCVAVRYNQRVSSTFCLTRNGPEPKPLFTPFSMFTCNSHHYIVTISESKMRCYIATA
ncbi:hypothetical protein AHF37_09684 [Paragonimus kellicotti]|nr:hypothetical protein AHF37_09684 [Paragonimus kellicotti]